MSHSILSSILAVPLTALGAGFLFARRLRWSPLERLAVAISLSLLLTYAASFAVFALHGPPGAAWWISAANLLALLGARRDLAGLASDRSVRRTVAAYLVLVAWAVLLLALIRNFSGGGWYGDWIEHWERARFFLERQPVGRRFLDGQYGLTARPPMMNVLVAHLLAHGDRSFVAHQLVSAALNLLLVVPAALLVRVAGARARAAHVALVALLALNPFVVQNAIYGWTKQLAAFFVLVSLALYARGLRLDDAGRRVAAVGVAAIGCLAHYSAAPFALALGLHHLGARLARRRRRALAEALAAMLVAATVLATWVGWSVRHYGWIATFEQNPTMLDSERLSFAANLTKVAGNLVATTVPYPLRWAGVRDWFGPGRSFGALHDAIFLLYQTSFPMALGLAGLVIVAWIVRRRRPEPDPRPSARRRSERRYWAFVLGFGGLVGVAAHGTSDRFGLAHVALQPVVILGLAVGAAIVPRLSARWRLAAALAAATDLCAGILLHVAAQTSDLRPLLAAVPPSLRQGLVRLLVSHSALGNALLKQRTGLTFLGDVCAGGQAALYFLAAIAGALFVAALARAELASSGPGES